MNESGQCMVTIPLRLVKTANCPLSEEQILRDWLDELPAISNGVKGFVISRRDGPIKVEFSF